MINWSPTEHVLEILFKSWLLIFQRFEALWIIIHVYWKQSIFFWKKILKNLLKVITKELNSKSEKTNVKPNSQAAENEKQAIQSGKLRVFITSMPWYSYTAWNFSIVLVTFYSLNVKGTIKRVIEMELVKYF